MKKILTLCLIHNDSQILLGYKKRGFGQGRWNGFGGKVHNNESIEAAALREVEEEVGVRLSNIIKRGVLTFEFVGQPEILEVHVFSATEFIGQPSESEEMKPAWFDLDSIPYSQMWPDDSYWLPLLLENKNFEGCFLFKNHNTLISHQLKEI